jgi:hypothetical protein
MRKRRMILMQFRRGRWVWGLNKGLCQGLRTVPVVKAEDLEILVAGL